MTHTWYSSILNKHQQICDVCDYFVKYSVSISCLIFVERLLLFLWDMQLFEEILYAAIGDG